MVSGTWKIKKRDTSGKLLLGSLEQTGAYYWIELLYLPPIMLDLQWHESE